MILFCNSSSAGSRTHHLPYPTTGGTSKQTSAGVDIRKLENEDDDAPMKLPSVSMDLRLAIAQARQAKGISQKDLATKLMIPAKTIQVT